MAVAPVAGEAEPFECRIVDRLDQRRHIAVHAHFRAALAPGGASIFATAPPRGVHGPRFDLEAVSLHELMHLVDRLHFNNPLSALQKVPLMREKRGRGRGDRRGTGGLERVRSTSASQKKN